MLPDFARAAVNVQGFGEGRSADRLEDFESARAEVETAVRFEDLNAYHQRLREAALNELSELQQAMGLYS